MLRWFGVGKGDEVIIPAYTYSATANVVVHCGAKPVMVDIGEDFNIDAQKIKAAVTSKTKVIIPVDLAGYPCDYEAINSLVVEPGIKSLFKASSDNQRKLGRILVLADAAHSIGARYHGKMSGNLTDITVFSFHAVKNLTTAEGGAVCLNLSDPFDNEEEYKCLCIKSLHGQTKDALAKTQIGNWKYDIIEPGYKYNMTDIQASMGLVELERYNADMLIRRKEIFDAYSDRLSEFAWAQIPEYENDYKTSSYHVFLLRIKNIGEDLRDKIIQSIFSKGVSVNVHFIPLPMLSYYKNSGYNIDHYPVSQNAFSREISLPVYYDLTNEQVKLVLDAVIDSVEENLQL